MHAFVLSAGNSLTSGKSQDADSEYSTDWAFDENEYDASGSGEQEEMERDSETGVCHLLCLKL